MSLAYVVTADDAWESALDLPTRHHSGSDSEMQRSPMATQTAREKTSTLDLQQGKEWALASVEAE